MREIHFAPTARHDIDDIWDYIGEENPDAANRFVALLIEKFRLLAAEPDIGRSRSHLSEDLRSLPVKKYVIFYRPSKHQLEIIRVLSGYRDIDRIFDEE